LKDFSPEHPRLKILLLSNKAPFPPNDGSSIAVSNMAIGLRSNGAEVRLLSINTRKHFKEDSQVSEEIKNGLHYQSVFRNTDPGIAGALLNLFTPRSYFVSRFYFSGFRKALVSALRQKSDIVQLEGVFMCSYIPLIRKHSAARIVLRAHNAEHRIWERHIPNETSFLKRMYLRLQARRLRTFERESVLQCDAVVPMTAQDAKVFQQLGYRGPLFPCISGVDLSEYDHYTEIQPRPHTVFYFGSMDWLPNQEAIEWFVNKCWARIRAGFPSARLVIGGRGMPLKFFRLATPEVSILENVENAKVFFRQYEIMIVPLLSGSGLRIKIIEGMASEKPIVSTSIGAEGTGCTHGVNILIADDPDEFADCVLKLLKDAELRTRIKREAREFANSEFDNRKLTNDLLEFYGRLLHE
jgi:glycosyltransferase involved in cell wall biosynthesis